MTSSKRHIYPSQPLVTQAERNELCQHKSGLLWFMGLSGSGKSTICHLVDQMLHQRGVHSYVLDGDNVRTGLNQDLGLSPAHRQENIRRTGEVAKLMVDAGLLVLAAFITPYRDSQRFIRSLMAGWPFHMIYVRCPLGTCRLRDPKGLYRLAEAGEITNLTGVGDSFQEPEDCDLILDSDAASAEESARKVMDFIEERGMITSFILQG